MPNYKKLSPSQLVRLGYSPTAERYALSGVTPTKSNTISKRRYYEQRLGTTLESRATEYKAGTRQYDKPARAKAAAARTRTTREFSKGFEIIGNAYKERRRVQVKDGQWNERKEKIYKKVLQDVKDRIRKNNGKFYGDGHHRRFTKWLEELGFLEGPPPKVFYGSP